MDNNENNIEPAFEFNESLRNRNFAIFDVDGEPFAKQRPRATKKGRYITIYTPRETKLYEEKVRVAYNKIYNGKKLNGDLTVDIEGIFSIPKSISKNKAIEMLKGNIPHIKKPDCDNMGKICLDALNGVAYEDDAIINKLNISKKYGKDPKVRIIIKENKTKKEGE